LKYCNSCGWSDSVTEAFYCLLESSPDKGPWFSLTHDIYPLFESHWDLLCPGRKKSEMDHVWKKHVQDSLSHKRTFENGREVFGRTGYWRLISLPNKLADKNSLRNSSESSSKRQKISNSQHSSSPIQQQSPQQFAQPVQLQQQRQNSQIIPSLDLAFCSDASSTFSSTFSSSSSLLLKSQEFTKSQELRFNQPFHFSPKPPFQELPKPPQRQESPKPQFQEIPKQLQNKEQPTEDLSILKSIFKEEASWSAINEINNNMNSNIQFPALESGTSSFSKDFSKLFSKFVDSI